MTVGYCYDILGICFVSGGCIDLYVFFFHQVVAEVIIIIIIIFILFLITMVFEYFFYLYDNNLHD